MNIEERRLEVEQQKQARAEYKARVIAELAELTELAPQVLRYGVVLTMVDKQQTPAQRRAIYRRGLLDTYTMSPVATRAAAPMPTAAPVVMPLPEEPPRRIASST